MDTWFHDRYFVVRAASLYIAVVMTGVVWIWRRPNRRAVAGAALGFFWNLPALLGLQLAASYFGWWNFDAQGGLFLGIPVEVYLSWAWLWGFVLAIGFPSLPLALIGTIALLADLALMPAAAPVVRLGPHWLVGEVFGLLLALLPGIVLARWTARHVHLAGRMVLQMVAFSGLLLFVLPAIAIDGTGGHWLNPVARPVWQLSLIVQALAIPALFGVTAVQEFVTRGHGTPVPFDPPRRLVTTGVYAYIRNPMQAAAVVLLFLLGIVLDNLWVSAAGVMAHSYSAGIAGWDEDEDLRQRFGESWTTYRRAVRGWIPGLRPWFPADRAPARLYVSESCGMCSEVGLWFARHGARQLVIVPAEFHPHRTLTRITYDPNDGSTEFSGIPAIARALEHIHLGWAMLGWVLRLPVISPLVQLLVDASGGGPREVVRSTRS